MIDAWYLLFNAAEFESAGLVSRSLALFLPDRGEKEFLITMGNTLSVTHEGVMLPVRFNDENPYARDGFAIYQDSNDNVWIGYEVSEE